MRSLADIQKRLEDHYGAHTGIDVRDFVRGIAKFDELGRLLIEQSADREDINIALLLDRDILGAWQYTDGSANQALSESQFAVPFEEVSHFVYLSWNHGRGRNVTTLEMEMQSEIDRLFLAYHGGLGVPAETQKKLLEKLLHLPYEKAGPYETARVAAAALVRGLGSDPGAWTEEEFRLLRKFFHSDLSQKLELSRHRIVHR